ncbi:hypothetical protein FACS1894126_1980 [Alphaproteobacteria bacterium]|nr:hypothetical protein FACS1894126_1980 [Alphaproteobacteria bacterium]
MITNRRVRWNKEALEFFESADDESLVLDIIISYSCASQTGVGFEELVNSINSDGIRRKIKKVNITDTSYLYRHTVPEFLRYSDPNEPTDWFLKNKDSVSKLMVDYTMKSWTDGLRDVKFQQWIKQIRIDFAGDESGNNVEQEFRDAVLVAANEAVSKGIHIQVENLDFFSGFLRCLQHMRSLISACGRTIRSEIPSGLGIQ